jgi:hypothetical protein
MQFLTLIPRSWWIGSLWLLNIQSIASYPLGSLNIQSIVAYYSQEEVTLLAHSRILFVCCPRNKA